MGEFAPAVNAGVLGDNGVRLGFAAATLRRRMRPLLSTQQICCETYDGRGDVGAGRKLLLGAAPSRRVPTLFFASMGKAGCSGDARGWRRAFGPSELGPQ